ncbi:hypothetical protein D3C72_1281400 [compost metagenome]
MQTIEQQQPSGQRFARTHDQFQRFSRLHGAHDADQRREHAHGRARLVRELLLLRKQAGIARLGARARVEHAHLPVETDHGARHQRHSGRHAGAVDGVARGEVVGAVEHHRGGQDQFGQARAVEALLQGHYFNLGIDAGQGFTRRQHFRLAHTGRRVGDLALQIGQVDRVVIDEGQLADAAGGQVHGRRRAEPARADHQHMRIEQGLLAFDADLIKQDVARVAQQLVVVHGFTSTANPDHTPGSDPLGGCAPMGHIPIAKRLTPALALG